MTNTLALRTLGLRNALTIPLLLGGIVIGGVGWYVGVVLLWTSPTWRWRDKILATLIVPGGVPGGFLIGAFGLPRTAAVDVPGLVGVLQVLVVIGPVVMAIRLGRVESRRRSQVRRVGVAAAAGRR